MKRFLKSILISSMISPLLTGCWDHRELNTLGLMFGLGVDMDKQGQVQVSAQVAIPSEISSKASGGKGVSVCLFQASAPTLLEAIQQLNKTSSRPMVLSQISILVFGEQFARKHGIEQTIESWHNEASVRPDFYVMVAKDTTAEKVLSILTPVDSIPSEKMFLLLDNLTRTSAAAEATTGDELIEDITTAGLHPVISGIGVVGDEKEGKTDSNISSVVPDATIAYKGLSLFNKDKLVGWLDETCATGYNYIRNNVKTTLSHLDLGKNNKITLKTLATHTNTTVKMINGEPVISIHVKERVNVSSAEHGVAALEKLREQQLTKQLENTVQTVQKKYKVDIFGFGKKIHQTYPRFWKKVSDNWENHFANLKVNFKVDVAIKLVGSDYESFRDKIK